MDVRTLEQVASQPPTRTSTTAGPQAQRISFAVRGLSSKDERLFKSFVRLIAHRTAHSWEPVEGVAEVCVSPTAVVQEGARHLLLVVSNGEVAAGHHVNMPFHADELERCLDRLGVDVVAARRDASPRAPLPRRFRLIRWPQSVLLKAPQRMRLEPDRTNWAEWKMLVASVLTATNALQ